MMNKVRIILLCVVLNVILVGCGSNSWDADMQFGCYKKSEGDEYPWVSAVDWGHGRTNVSIKVDKMSAIYYSEANKKEEDGSYLVSTGDWNYHVRFNGDGKCKVTMEKAEDASFGAGITRGRYKKATGTYDYFEAYESTVSEQIDQMYENLNN